MEMGKDKNGMQDDFDIDAEMDDDFKLPDEAIDKLKRKAARRARRREKKLRDKDWK